MSDLFLKVLLFTIIPVAAAILGGIIAAYRPPGPRLGSALQHFAAGMVFAAVGVELLPDVVSKHAPVATIIGFTIGISLMLVIRSITEKAEKEANPDSESESESQRERGLAPAGACEPALPVSMIATIGVDVAIDGLLIGIGFAAGAKEGILLIIALTLELLSLGLATSATLNKSGISKGKSIAVTSGLALIPLVGASLGALLLGGLSGNLLEAVLAFGVAALLYLVTEELLVEAHEVPETPLITATFFIGFLLLLVVTMIV
ncbi:MAG: transporter [Chloroflexi bacterium]|nr:transporter [Chloroflexota bacterium]OJV99075.1 MAG: transporter [Chloroflexi bacterium 54-19]